MKGDIKAIITTSILIIAGLFACYHLTNWSYDLSQFSAEKSSVQLSGEAKQTDTKAMADSSQQKIEYSISSF